MKNPRFRVGTAIYFLAAATSGICLHAAPVTFGKPITLANEHDIITGGTLERAVNFGGPDQIVNGVVFNAGNTGSGSQSVDFGLTTLAASDDSIVVLNDSPTFAGPGEPADSLSAVYKNLLTSAAYNNTTKGTLTLTLTGLKTGTAYTIQILVNDSRDFHGGCRYETVSSGGATSDPLVYSSTGAAGGVGQYVLGTFTADGANQVFRFAPVNPASDDAQINAFQLRVTPPAHAAPASTPTLHKGR